MSEAIALITTHEDDAQARLISQYQKPNAVALIRAFASRTQVQENALHALQSAQYTDSAQGAQLDNVAAAVGVVRGGLSDDQLRALIIAQIAKQCGNATRGSLIQVIQKLFATNDVHLISPTSLAYTPQRAGAVMQIGIGTSPLSNADVKSRAQLLLSAITAGVAVCMITHFDSAAAFAFAGPQPWVKGFGEGHFASLVTAKEAV